MRALITQLVRFGLVGAVGLVVDVGVFNLLRLDRVRAVRGARGPGVREGDLHGAGDHRELDRQPVLDLRPRSAARRWCARASSSSLVSLGGMVIGLGCLWVSHYLLGYTSLLADNISTNVDRAGARHGVPVLAVPGVGVQPAAHPAGGGRCIRRPCIRIRRRIRSLRSRWRSWMRSANAPHAGLVRRPCGLRLPTGRNGIEAALHQVVQHALHQVGARHVAQHDRMLEARC